MSESERGTPRYRSLHESKRVLSLAAPLVRFGLFAAGVGIFLDQVRPLLSDAQFTWGERRVMGLVALVTLGGFGLAGWLAGKLLRAAAELMEVVAEGAEAAVNTSYLIEARVVPALLRVADAVERGADGRPNDGPARPADAIRRAVRERRWGRAEELLRGLRRDDPDAVSLGAEFTRARQAEVERLRGRLDRARAAGDADEVVSCRDALTQHLRGEVLHRLDEELVGWLVSRVRERVGAGNVSREDAELAARVADSFADTSEGASLSAALPGLRRRAGLCPRCARPFAGRGESCDECRGGRP